MSQTANTLPALQAALDDYLGWKGDPVAILKAAVAENPGFLLGHHTLAALCSLGGEPGSARPIRRALAAAAAAAHDATPAEQLHLAAARAWASDDITGAASAWEEALALNPRDLLALRLAHDTHFYLGDAAKLRDVPLAVLPSYAHDRARRGFVRGMAAFGLEECGDYAAADREGRMAVEENPADSWAVHAVAHVLEMTDRAVEGEAWLRDLGPYWQAAPGLAVHQWWHMALYLIELGRLDEVLALYDAHIAPGEGPQVLDLVDAAALLWRLNLAGADVGPRWAALSPAWSRYANDHVLAFNDIHIAMTLIGAGDAAALDQLEASLNRYAAAGTGTNAKMSIELGQPVIRALRAFDAGDDDTVVAILQPLFRRLAPVGGSNAQRDLIIQTLGIAAHRAGAVDVAKTVQAERARLKVGTPLAWTRLH